MTAKLRMLHVSVYVVSRRGKERSRILLQSANTMRHGWGLGEQIHTNHFILWIQSSSRCLCLQESGRNTGKMYIFVGWSRQKLPVASHSGISSFGNTIKESIPWKVLYEILSQLFPQKVLFTLEFLLFRGRRCRWVEFCMGGFRGGPRGVLPPFYLRFC